MSFTEPTGAARAALVQHLGELTMDAVCSVTRVRELEAENQDLRKLVTEERVEVKRLQALVGSLQSDVVALRASSETLQTAVRASKPRARK